MNKNLKTLTEAFVAIVGIAALIHSTWTVATFTGGEGPQISLSDIGKGVLTILAWLWWVLPGFLAAFALEVGQIVTASQIKRNVGRKIHIRGTAVNVKIITFVIFSLATYLLQLTYLLHHYPTRQLSQGLSPASRSAGMFVMELIVWCMPLLLPVATLLYTAGDESEELPPSKPEQSLAVIKPVDDSFLVICPHCDWQRQYTNEDSAQYGFNGHMSKHKQLLSADHR